LDDRERLAAIIAAADEIISNVGSLATNARYDRLIINSVIDTATVLRHWVGTLWRDYR
jgi:hypothetical protein